MPFSVRMTTREDVEDCVGSLFAFWFSGVAAPNIAAFSYNQINEIHLCSYVLLQELVKVLLPLAILTSLGRLLVKLIPPLQFYNYKN